MKLGVVTPVLDGRARFRACASSVRAAAAALRGGEIVHFVRESAASREPAQIFGPTDTDTRSPGLRSRPRSR